MPFFDKTQLLPPDPIFDLAVKFKKDPRTFKVNLGVGSYKTADLKSYVLTCVRKAEEELAGAFLDKEYLPIDGDEEFLALAKNLILGNQLQSELQDRSTAIQAVGGTGALKVGGDFLSEQGVKKIYIPDLTWPNHKMVFKSGGLNVEIYPYYDRVHHCINFDMLRHSVLQMEPGSVIVLHASCHNPTGTDPNKQQWDEIAALIRDRQVLPFFDLAYQGFGQGLEEDALALRTYARHFEEMMVAYSFSKNFGIYGERLGVLWIKAPTPTQATNVWSHLKLAVRKNYSNPPLHGARIVKTVLKNPVLKGLWEMELGLMRERVNGMRDIFCDRLKEKQASFDTDALRKQRGMFCYLALSNEQVARLIDEFAIYLPIGGRVNVAGMNQSNIDYAVDSIITVMK